MRKVLWAILALIPLVTGGLLYAKSVSTQTGFTCPLTGEQLPCPKCCPLNQR